MLDPRDFAPLTFLERAAEVGLGESPARRWLAAVLNDGCNLPSQWVDRQIGSKRIFSQFSELPQLVLEERRVSPVDGFEKLLFRTGDGLPIETVLIPLEKPGAVSLCLSSQVGCVMQCAFCATGRMAVRRNLQTWEILDQFVQARQLVRTQGRRVTGAVFMGMGEPFLNYDRVLAAADLLRFPVAGAITAKSITISTVGMIQEIDRFTEERRPFRLSISLGSALDEKRRRLVPVAARTPVREVMAAATRHATARRDRVMLAYVCIRGENTGEEDAIALAELIGETPVRLDLIDVTDPSGRYLPPTDSELRCFRDALSRHLKQPVVRRYSGGADIRAACGTLAGERLDQLAAAGS